jgi:deoxyguanosine kinase
MTKQESAGRKPIVESLIQPARKPSAGTRQFSSEKAEAHPWIVIEGPLRAGKSTLAALLAKRMSATRIAEPENNPFLPRFYAGEAGMAFASQMWFLRQRVAQLSSVAKRRSPVVSDYMLQKDKLFAHLTLSNAELAVYRDYYAAHAPCVRPDLVIYLRANPAVLLERRRRKGVHAEQGLGHAYTRQIAEAYDHFFAHYTGSQLLVVDTSAIDFAHSEREREMLLDRILAPVHGTEHFAPLARIA